MQQEGVLHKFNGIYLAIKLFRDYYVCMVGPGNS
jgi:hypothetical protein